MIVLVSGKVEMGMIVAVKGKGVSVSGCVGIWVSVTTNTGEAEGMGVRGATLGTYKTSPA